MFLNDSHLKHVTLVRSNDKDEKITILFLDVDIEDIKQFFTNILNQTEEFSSCKAIVNLLGHTDIGVKIEVEPRVHFKVEDKVNKSIHIE